jgi:hypothetical protein
MSAINNCSNDVLRLILKEASPNSKCIQNNQLVCKKWYKLFRDLRLWRDLYARDYQKNEQLSDLANYYLLYKIKSMENLNDKKKYIPISELYPEKIIFGPVIKNYNGSKHIITSFVDTYGKIIQPMILKVSGFTIEINFAKSVKIIECHNKNFKLLIDNLANHLIRNFNKIGGSGSCSNLLYNGNQYKSLADVSQKTPNPIVVVNQIQNNKIKIQNNFILDLSIGQNKFSWTYAENCERCNKWHKHGYKIYDLECKRKKICALYETPLFENVNATKKCKNIEKITYTNSTLVIKMQGYTYNPQDNTLSVNWACEEIWFSN